jgi:hypothetical protein
MRDSRKFNLEIETAISAITRLTRTQLPQVSFSDFLSFRYFKNSVFAAAVLHNLHKEFPTFSAASIILRYKRIDQAMKLVTLSRPRLPLWYGSAFG